MILYADIVFACMCAGVACAAEIPNNAKNGMVNMLFFVCFILILSWCCEMSLFVCIIA